MEANIFHIVSSASIFLITYAFIIWDKFNRTVVALVGGALMLVFGILTPEIALKEIDYNTLGLLIGMMAIVAITKISGVFEYLAIKIVKIAKGEPIRLIILFSIITGILSAFLDNVTTILLILPITLSVAKDLDIDPIPFVICEIFSSNVGGTATLIGDPPNIMIGSLVGFSYLDFIKNNALISIFLLFITTYLLALIYKKKLVSTSDLKAKVMRMNENGFIKDRVLLFKSLSVLFLTLLAFMFHGVLHIESSLIAVIGALVLILISKINIKNVFLEIEWKTIFFFVGLFIMVGGIKEAGILDMLAVEVLNITQGNIVYITIAILWVSAIASAFIDNIPFVATMIPLIKHLGVISGMNLTPIWWALSLGACLGGNGTIVGASANVIAIGISEEKGHKITFRRYFKIAFPLMIFTIIICTIYLYIFYL
ncbi:MAG: hypothetical protein A2Y24_03950 [Clostridiales bacterium GWE2_32_10]|nr:MAG: hypothetical protein A2Y24_03950 [Clostridiales bacterium GWE2_32_10]